MSRKQKEFPDSENSAVFTTTFVIKDRRPITYVTHDEEDGAWQFFSDDEFENFEQVAMVVLLGEILKIDPTVIELADMPVGYFAVRSEKGGPWTIEAAQSS